MHTRRTLLLDRDAWDITLDGVGRIALTQGDVATAQNVANESRLFTKDAYFTQDRGVPHFAVELGRKLSASVLRSYLRKAALLAPDVKEVADVEVTELDPKTRKLSGSIQFTTKEGENAHAAVTTYF